MTDTKALLLTDVVGSTQLSEQLGDRAMAELWTAHDRAARDLLPIWRGREIDKTDGMLLLFDHPADALGYALACHRALAALPVPLKARAGLHVGPVIMRENTPDDVARGAKPLEVDGLAKPMAARVMSLARGGQTLLTSEARQALGDTGLNLQSHGHWSMKGVAEPVELFECSDDPSHFAAPPDGDKIYRVVRSGDRWLPVREIPNNLPQQATSFIGRERELDELKAALDRARLVTLLGMGGLGKTRLSLQVAAELMAEFPDGAWFLDLSPLRDPALVVGEAAQVLAVREEPGRPLLQTVCAHLSTRRVLLVIDNCEHLIRPAAELAHALLRAAPGVRIMASSREALRVSGEQAVPILPLPVPARGDSIEALRRSTAVRLFVARAQMHKPAFELDEREAPAVAELVARLEGIPLALELAAARVRALSVADINKRLADRYKLLTGGSRVLQERQQTLRALVDWSYEILQPEERLLFKRLSVFTGGFDLAAAEEVCGDEPLDGNDVMDWLGSLVEKSLVMMEERDEGTRYRMLETLRDYAHEKLVQDGDAPKTAARHCQHFFAVAKEGNRGLQGAAQAHWVRRLEGEVDNLRAATSAALSGGADGFVAVKLAVALMGFWMLRGYATEGRKAVHAALALPSVQGSDLARAWGLYVGAALAGQQGDHAEARQMLESCLALRRGLDNPVEIAATLSTLSLARLQSGDAAGAAQVEREALQMFRNLDDRAGETIGLLHLGQIALYVGDVEPAHADLERALALARETRSPELEGESLWLLGEAALHRGDLAAADGHMGDALAVSRRAGDKQGEANALHGLGRTALARGDAVHAGRHLHQALRAFQSYEMREKVVACLEDHAALALAQQRHDAAAELAAAAAQSRNRLALVRPPREELRWQATLARMRQEAGDDVFEPAWSRGRERETDDAVKLALAGSAP